MVQEATQLSEADCGATKSMQKGHKAYATVRMHLLILRLFSGFEFHPRTSLMRTYTWTCIATVNQPRSPMSGRVRTIRCPNISPVACAGGCSGLPLEERCCRVEPFTHSSSSFENSSSASWPITSVFINATDLRAFTPTYMCFSISKIKRVRHTQGATAQQ